MEISKENIDAAAAEESQIFDQAMNQARFQIMNDRIVVLRAYARQLEALLDEHGIEYRDPEPEAPTPIKRPQDRRPAKKAATKKAAPKT